MYYTCSLTESFFTGTQIDHVSQGHAVTDPLEPIPAKSLTQTGRALSDSSYTHKANVREYVESLLNSLSYGYLK